jgi:cytochrome P450
MDLPTLDTTELDRLEALAVAERLATTTRFARTEAGIAVLHQSDVAWVLRDRRFQSALGRVLQSFGPRATAYFINRRQSILSMEGPEHVRLRRLVSPAFTPAAADRHRPAMRQVIADLVDARASATTIELVGEVCEPYPIPIICEVLGAPASDWQLFGEWATGIFKIFNGNVEQDIDDIAAAQTALTDYVAALVERRRTSPGDDLLSDLIAAEEEGDRLDTPELCMLAEAVLMAGTDTTRNQLGCSMALLAERPALWAALREDRSRIPKAVEETMRYLGAVRLTVRQATEDIAIDGDGPTIPAGTLVTAHLAAANRDPDVFSDPDELDLELARSTEQMTFGSGIHRCLGAALARAELQEALGVLVDRFATVELASPVTWKPSANGIWGPAELHLSVTPA